MRLLALAAQGGQEEGQLGDLQVSLMGSELTTTTGMGSLRELKHLGEC